MSATEELRRMLDERGVEWMPINDSCTCWCMEVGDQTRDGFCIPVRFDGALHVDCVMSPTQVIAATLGRPTSDADLEQALSFMRIWISDDAHLGESDISYALERAEGLRKLDAIESAIAATLGGGECENVSYRVDESRFKCSECGFGCWVKNVATGRDELPAHCPQCGRKVNR